MKYFLEPLVAWGHCSETLPAADPAVAIDVGAAGLELAVPCSLVGMGRDSADAPRLPADAASSLSHQACLLMLDLQS